MPTVDLAARPAPSDYADFQAAYVAACPDGDILETLAREGRRGVAMLRALPRRLVGHAYAPGKWTVAEVVAHVADSERVFAYRALRFGRGDATPLATFDQELWVPNCHAASRAWHELVDELETVRAASLHLFRSFAPEDWLRRGLASGTPMSVQALAWVVAGHELHHRRILIDRYGVAPPLALG